MKLLITGASGALAKGLIRLCRQKEGIELYLTSRSALPNEKILYCDLTNRSELVQLIETTKPTHVIHLAGSYSNDIDRDFSINTMSAAWLGLALSNLDSKSRLVLVGSAAEYGHVDSCVNPLKEDLPIRPVSIYGLSKAMQTQVGQYFTDAGIIDVVTARIFNVIGPGLSPFLFVGKAEQQIDAYRRGLIRELEFGNLQAIRDYVTVDEAARLLLLLASKGVSGCVYNIGSGNPISMSSLLALMLEQAGIPDAPIKIKLDACSATSAQVSCTYADVSLIRELDQRTLP